MTQEIVTETEEVPEGAIETELSIPDAQKTVDELFRYSAFVHVGVGAQDCTDGENGRCRNDAHFHAWLRLPNQFQHEDIQRKARAARARTMRALDDPESDAFLILEAELSATRKEVDRAALVEQLLAANDMDERITAMREVEATEEFSNRMADFERQVEIEAMLEEDRPEDELAELLRHTERYMAAVDERIERVRGPRRRSFETMDLDALMGLIREQRINEHGLAAFSSAYTRYEWFVCTLEPVLSGRPSQRVFKELRDLDGSAPEVVNALRVAFRGLEMSLQRGVGNW